MSVLKIDIKPKISKYLVLYLIRLSYLEYFLQHPGQLLSHDQIRNRVWEMNSEAFSNIIAAQIRLVRKKMAELGYENSIETVRGLGYRFIPPVQCHAEQ
jgi:DNA-binding response OmpR family regulator